MSPFLLGRINLKNIFASVQIIFMKLYSQRNKSHIVLRCFESWNLWLSSISFKFQSVGRLHFILSLVYSNSVSH